MIDLTQAVNNSRKENNTRKPERRNINRSNSKSTRADSRRESKREYKTPSISKLSVERRSKEEKTVDMPISEIMKEIKDIQAIHGDIFKDVIDDFRNGLMGKHEIIEKIVDFHRDKDITSDMVTKKVIYMGTFIALELFTVKYLGLKVFKGLGPYMCKKMPNFMEFMYYMSSKKIDETAKNGKGENYHYYKLTQIAFFEFVIFISTSMFAGSGTISPEVLEQISNVTFSDVDSNMSNNPIGYIGAMVSRWVSNSSDIGGTKL